MIHKLIYTLKITRFKVVCMPDFISRLTSRSASTNDELHLNKCIKRYVSILQLI